MKLPPRISLARLPTPIHALKKISASLGKEIYIWRDDMTGFNSSGNKIRKLEFLLAEAIQKGADTIITCGGPQSNHTRATSAMARELGLDVSILVLPKPGFDRTKTANSNLLMNEIFGAEITWLNYDEFVKAGSIYEPFLDREMERLKRLGKKPYAIPLGGSNPLGCFGYISAIPEMLSIWQKVVPGSKAPDAIFCALGSGGTFLGLQMGLEAQKLETELFGINVIGPIETVQAYITRILQTESPYDLPGLSKNARVIDGYVGQGYAAATQDDLLFYRDLATLEGILLDPCYTGKAFQGMVSEIKKNPKNFGDRILFLHSGGGFGNFAYAEEYAKAFSQSF